MVEDDVDFAVAAYRDDGEWRVVALKRSLADDLEGLSDALARFPSEVGVLGLVSIDDDFFVILRRSGTELRVMLSDLTAAIDWPFAGDVVELLDVDDPDDDTDPRAVGDLGIVSDLGMSAADLAMLCDDADLYPDDILRDVADRIGFGVELETILE